MVLRGSVLMLALVAGCFHGDATKPTTPPVGGDPATTPTGIVIADGSIGPIDTTTPATLDALRAKLPGYEVKAERDDHDFLKYDAYKDGALVFSVNEENGKVLNVMTADPKVSVSNHPTWHAGAMFSEAKSLSRCACWGGKYTCWKDGEHVAATFDRTCSKNEDDTHVLVVLDGSPIVKLVWSPVAFSANGAATTSPNDPKTGGHGLGGTVKPVPGGTTKPPKDPCDYGGDDDDDE